MDFIPDYEIAFKQISAGEGFYGAYSQAYAVTNEKLRKTMRFMPENCDNALVVAASGDQPLFCSLYGAKHVDTFDISYNAKCIMDIKVAALNTMGYSDYISFLDNLFMFRLNGLRSILDIKNMKSVLYKLPKIESDYICTFKEIPLFSRGPRPRNNTSLPTLSEYNKLRQTGIRPYNCALIDIYKICGSLTKKYDFIHLSNIFDYVIENDYEELLLPIMKFVKPGGRIVMESFEEDSHFYLDFIGPKILAMSNNNFVLKKSHHMHIFERVR